MHGKCYIISTLFCFISIQATGAQWFYQTGLDYVECSNNNTSSAFIKKETKNNSLHATVTKSVTHTKADINNNNSVRDINDNSDIFPSSSTTTRAAFYALYTYNNNNQQCACSSRNK